MLDINNRIDIQVDKIEDETFSRFKLYLRFKQTNKLTNNIYYKKHKDHTGRFNLVEHFKTECLVSPCVSWKLFGQKNMYINDSNNLKENEQIANAI